jgi:hypothetical protein
VGQKAWEVLVSGNYRAARRLAVAATAIVSVAVLLAGCGTDPGSTGAAESGHAGPQAGTRAQAEAFAGHLIAGLVLPPGTEPARLSPLPATLRDPWGGPAGPAASGAVDRGRVDAASLTPADAEAFMLTHAPRGAGDAGTGQQKGSRGIIERYLYFQLGSLPKGIDSAEVQVLMVPRGAASTLIATYVHVAWFPSRTAAEHLDTARFGAVSIRAIVTNPKPRDVTRTFRSPADIAMLAGLLNGFAAAPKAARTCLSSSASFQITFQTRTAQQAGVTVFTYGCNSATITVGGVPQPALLDPRNALATTAGRLLGLGGTGR